MGCGSTAHLYLNYYIAKRHTPTQTPAHAHTHTTTVTATQAHPHLHMAADNAPLCLCNHEMRFSSAKPEKRSKLTHTKPHTHIHEYKTHSYAHRQTSKDTHAHTCKGAKQNVVEIFEYSLGKKVTTIMHEALSAQLQIYPVKF